MQNLKFPALLTAVFLIAGSSAGQSLGDVARQQKQKQQAKPSTTAQHKVITDDDMPQHSADSTDSPATSDKSKPADPAPSSSGKKSAEEWKSQIQAQKAKVAAMQSDVDKLNASVHFVTAKAYYNGVQYNQEQLQKQQQAERLQKQLEEQKRSLSDMQEACRSAGFGSSVYEP